MDNDLVKIKYTKIIVEPADFVDFVGGFLIFILILFFYLAFLVIPSFNVPSDLLIFLFNFNKSSLFILFE